MRRTTASGDEVEGTTDVIARLVGFKFSFADGYSMRFHPVPMNTHVLTGTVEYSTCRLHVVHM